MKVIADTNVLLRAITGDDERQAKIARKCLAQASTIIVGSVTLCELVWVLLRSYAEPRDRVITVIRRLLEVDTVATDRNMVLSGLAVMEAGGDFADGIIAYEGKWLGGEELVSFDKQAVKHAGATGVKARLLR